MKINQQKLYNIILEEYLKEEGVLDEAMSQEKASEVIAWIKGAAPRPDWLTDDYGKSGQSKAGQAPMDPSVDRSAETMPFDASGELAADSDSVEDQIFSLIQGMAPEDVQDLFQAVFVKIPGVEMGPAEEEPETLYSPGAEGRPQAGFRLEELKELIREMIAENV